MSRDRLYSAGCALLVAACVLATVPVLAMGVNDDFSYVWTARGLAATGHFVYSGWSEPMVGVQAIWAAWLIRLFGFSFTLVRLSMLPFAAGCAFLLYRLGRCAGLNPSYAAFGSLSVTLSPLFIPLSASFMTDVSSFFFWLACVYCALRAVRSAGSLRTGAWLAAAAAAGVAGGSVRQIVWVVPLLTLPVVAWARRREKPVAVTAALLWCASAAAAAWCVRWFNSQPSTHLVVEPGVPGWPRILLYAAACAVELTMCCGLLLLPVLAIYVAGWRTAMRTRVDIRAGVGFTALLATLHWWFRLDLLLGNTVTQVGVLNGGAETLGSRPVILTHLVRGVLKVALAAGGIVTAATLAGVLRREKPSLESARPAANPEAAGMLWFTYLLAPSCLLYALILFYRGILFDRYLIPLFPVLVIPLLWWRQRSSRNSPPALGWAVLGLLALYGVAATHDYFAASRARVEAVAALTAAGIPRTSIMAGLEIDAWTELEHAGHIAPASIPARLEAAGAFRTPRRYPISRPVWVWAHIPSIDPAYFVTFSRLDGLQDSTFPPVRYRIWLPPSERQVLTQVAMEATGKRIGN